MLHVAALARGVKEGLSQEVTLALSPKPQQESPLLGCKHCAEKRLGLREKAESGRWGWPQATGGGWVGYANNRFLLTF